MIAMKTWNYSRTILLAVNLLSISLLFQQVVAVKTNPSLIPAKDMYLPFAKKKFSLTGCPGMGHELLKACSSHYNSCREQCGQHSMEVGSYLKTCSCDTHCLMFEDCCPDFRDYCPLVTNMAVEMNQRWDVSWVCVNGYSLITSCPPGWDVSMYDWTPYEDQYYLPVTDLRSGLPFRSIHQLICNGLNASFARTWESYKVASFLHFRSNSTRLCNASSALVCSSEFRSRDPECDYAAMTIDIKNVCAAIYNELESDYFRRYWIQGLATMTRVTNQTNGPWNVSRLDIVHSAQHYTALCKLHLIVGSDLSLKNPLSVLFNGPSQNKVFGYFQSPLRFLPWCPVETENIECYNLCPPNKIRHDGLCHDILSYRITFFYHDRADQCSSNGLWSWLIPAILNSNVFLQVAKIVNDDGIRNLKLSVKGDLARSHMTDPYLRPELRPAREIALRYRTATSLNAFTVCPNDKGDLCKVLYVLEEPDVRNLTSTADVGTNDGKQQKEPFLRLDPSSQITQSQPVQSTPRETHHNDPKFDINRKKLEESAATSPCCFCRFLQVHAKGSPYKEKDCGKLQLFHLLNLAGQWMSPLIRQYTNPDAIVRATLTESWLEDCVSCVLNQTNRDLPQQCIDDTMCLDNIPPLHSSKRPNTSPPSIKSKLVLTTDTIPIIVGAILGFLFLGD